MRCREAVLVCAEVALGGAIVLCACCLLLMVSAGRRNRTAAVLAMAVPITLGSGVRVRVCLVDGWAPVSFNQNPKN